MKCCETAVLNCMQREQPICWIMMDLDYRYLFLLIDQQFCLRMSSRAISWRSDTPVLPYFKVAWESFLVQLMGILWRIFSVCLEKESFSWKCLCLVFKNKFFFYSCEHDNDILQLWTWQGYSRTGYWQLHMTAGKRRGFTWNNILSRIALPLFGKP